MFENPISGQGTPQQPQPVVPPMPSMPQPPMPPGVGAPQPPADMFAGLDAGLGSPIPPVGVNPVQPGVVGQGMNPDPAGGSRKYFIVGFLVLLLIGIVVGGYFAYGKFSAMVNKDGEPAAVETPVETATPEVPVKTPVETATTAVATSSGLNTDMATTSAVTSSPLVVDSTSSPLTTTTSTTATTVDRTTDSDGDGLTDYEETNFYKTSPSVADTDGDGFSDGSEVKNGFNPLGTGKMIDNKITPQ